MLLGSHVSMSGKKMLQGSAEEAHKFGESTFMIYRSSTEYEKKKHRRFKYRKRTQAIWFI